MGANLISRVFAFQGERSLLRGGSQRRALKPNEFNLLVFMSLTALDADNPPVYFGGRDKSAFALGHVLTDDSTERERAAAYQAVKVAVGGLVEIGAIKRKQRGVVGRRAEFEIVLSHTGVLPAPRKRKVRGTESVPSTQSTDGMESIPSMEAAQGMASIPRDGMRSIPEWGTDVTPGEYGVPTPKEPRGSTEETGQEKPQESEPPQVLPVDKTVGNRTISGLEVVGQVAVTTPESGTELDSIRSATELVAAA